MTGRRGFYVQLLGWIDPIDRASAAVRSLGSSSQLRRAEWTE